MLLSDSPLGRVGLENEKNMHIINKISFSFIIRVPSGNDLLIFLWYNLLYLLNLTWSLNENGTFFVFVTRNLTLKRILHILFCIIAKYNYIHSEIFYNISLKTNKQKKKQPKLLLWVQIQDVTGLLDYFSSNFN